MPLRFLGELKVHADELPVEFDAPPNSDLPPALDWERLSCMVPPEREWVEKGWLPLRAVALLAGVGGIGKTLLAQIMASHWALGRDYVGEVKREHRVLMYAGEDDSDELWRRQVKIASAMGVDLADFQGRLILRSFDQQDIELMRYDPDERAMKRTPFSRQLENDVLARQPNVVILDNVSGLFGGNENARHDVRVFVTLCRSLAPNAAVLLLHHPAKALGSEWSGSTAWEATVRTRLWLGNTRPDQEGASEPDVLYLCRRKANYAAQDVRRLTYDDGMLLPDAAGSLSGTYDIDGAKQVVMRGFVRLDRIHELSCQPRSGGYLVTKIIESDLAEGYSRKLLQRALIQLLNDSALVDDPELYKYANRNPKPGLRLPV